MSEKYTLTQVHCFFHSHFFKYRTYDINGVSHKFSNKNTNLLYLSKIAKKRKSQLRYKNGGLKTTCKVRRIEN